MVTFSILIQVRIWSLITKLFCLVLHKNTICGYSLEAPHWGASNEYPQTMSLWRNDKNSHSIIIEFPLQFGYWTLIGMTWNNELKWWCNIYIMWQSCDNTINYQQININCKASQKILDFIHFHTLCFKHM